MTLAERGFTLLEVLLAMTVLGVVMAMLSLSLSGAVRMVEGTERDEVIYTMAQTAMRRISEDVAAAFKSQDGPFIGESVLEDGQRTDRLRFCSRAHLIFNPERQRPGASIIGYRLEKDEEDGRQYRLLRSDEPLLPGQPLSGGEEQPPAFVLADQLRSLQLTYFDDQGQEIDNWQTEIDENNPEQKEKLPVAIHCILDFWVDVDQEISQPFSVRIVVPGGAYSAD